VNDLPRELLQILLDEVLKAAWIVLPFYRTKTKTKRMRRLL